MERSVSAACAEEVDIPNASVIAASIHKGLNVFLCISSFPNILEYSGIDVILLS